MLKLLNSETHIINGQSLFDLALQEYGAIEAVFDVMENNNISNINSPISDGDKIVIKGEIVNPSIASYYKENNIKVVSGSSLVIYGDFNTDFGTDFY